MTEMKIKPQNQQNANRNMNENKHTFSKVLCVILAILLMIGISAIVANIVHKKGGGESVPVSGKIENGLSAYELAVQQGYDGSVQDWLASLSGKSAYEIAADNGYSGTEEEWASAVPEYPLSAAIS